MISQTVMSLSDTELGHDNESNVFWDMDSLKEDIISSIYREE